MNTTQDAHRYRKRLLDSQAQSEPGCAFFAASFVGSLPGLRYPH